VCGRSTVDTRSLDTITQVVFNWTQTCRPAYNVLYSRVSDFVSIPCSICISQITMTTGWLLLLLLVVYSQSVYSQSTTDDETCEEAGLLSEQQNDERILEQLFQQQLTILGNQQQLFQQHQTIITRLSKYTISTTFPWSFGVLTCGHMQLILNERNIVLQVYHIARIHAISITVTYSYTITITQTNKDEHQK